MTWEGLVRAESAAVAVEGPRVVGSMPLGVRATLLERGQWAEVRTAFEARDLEGALLLEGLRAAEWFRLSAHVALVEAAAEVLGLAGVRELGFVRTQESTMGGLFPNLLRSWVRSFRDDPASLLRLGPHIWQMAFREAGEFVIDHVEPAGADARIVNLAPLVESLAWRQLLEGSCTGILRLAGLGEGVAVTAADAVTTRLAFDWNVEAHA